MHAAEHSSSTGLRDLRLIPVRKPMMGKGERMGRSVITYRDGIHNDNTGLLTVRVASQIRGATTFLGMEHAELDTLRSRDRSR